MIKNIINMTQVPFVEKLLNISSARQRVIAGNIANAATPGYTARAVDFEQSLAQAGVDQNLTGLRTDERHLPIPAGGNSGKQVVVEDSGAAVDLEKEMALSAENQILYHTSATLISRQFRSLHAAIRGRY